MSEKLRRVARITTLKRKKVAAVLQNHISSSAVKISSRRCIVGLDNEHRM